MVLLALAGVALAKEKSIKITDKDMMRKSIVYDKNTPDVFYCPTSKPHGFEKLIVKYVNFYPSPPHNFGRNQKLCGKVLSLEEIYIEYKF